MEYAQILFKLNTICLANKMREQYDRHLNKTTTLEPPKGTQQKSWVKPDEVPSTKFSSTRSYIYISRLYSLNAFETLPLPYMISQDEVAQFTQLLFLNLIVIIIIVIPICCCATTLLAEETWLGITHTHTLLLIWRINNDTHNLGEMTASLYNGWRGWWWRWRVKTPKMRRIMMTTTTALLLQQWQW